MIFVFTQVEKRNGRIHPDVLETAESVIARDLRLAPANRVFFTMALKDEFSGLDAHGLKELLDATFLAAPDAVAKALNAAQKLDLDRKAQAAREWVIGAATASGVAGATPIPFSDAAVLVPIQTAMLAKISVTFGLGIRKGTLGTLVAGALTAGGLTNAGKYLATNLLKSIPGGNVAGGVIRAGVASSLTYAVGEAWIAVCGRLFKLGPAAVDALSKEEIRNMFMTEFKSRAKSSKPKK